MTSKITAKYVKCEEQKNGSISLVFNVSKESKYLLNRIRKIVLEPLATRQKPLSLSMTEYKSERTIKQNALMWAMLHKLTKEVSGSDNEEDVWEMYCTILQEVGAVSVDIWAIPEAEVMLKKAYRATRFISETDINGKRLNLYRCFPGTSKLNFVEMKKIIDYLLDKLAEHGIFDSDTEDLMDEYKTLGGKK